PVVRLVVFFVKAEDGIRDPLVTGVQTCALPIWAARHQRLHGREQVPVRPSCRVVNDRVAADAGLPIGAGVPLRPRDALRPLRPRSEERRVGKGEGAPTLARWAGNGTRASLGMAQ